MSDLTRTEPRTAQVLAGRYVLTEHLAEGGMGFIWRADDRVTGDLVAVKLLRHDLTDQATARFRFGREIRAMARLHHPGIVRIRDYGEDELGRPFYVMDLLDGRPLSGYRRGTFPLPLLLHLFEEVLDALAYAHARGVIHRDLKPENILLTRDSLRRFHATLVDFGIASVTHEGSSLGTPMASMVGGFVVGTPEYMAPEQVQGQVHEIGPSCDLYAVGILLFEYLTGNVPFSGATALSTATLQLVEPVPEIISTQPELVPDGLTDLIERLLEKDPWERPRFAAEVRAELSELRRESEAMRARKAGVEPSPDAQSRQMRALDRETGEGTARQTVMSAAPSISAQALDLPRGGYADGLDLIREDELPVLGFPQTRMLLWEALSEVHREGEAQVVFLSSGPVGAHQLPRWLRSHAEQNAVALSLVARFDTGGKGFVGAAESILRCVGLPREQVEEQARRYLLRHGDDEPYEIGIVTEFVRPAGQFGSNQMLMTPLSRRAVTDRLLRREATERPLVLSLESVDSSTLVDEVEPFVRHLLQGNLVVPTPILVVVHAVDGLDYDDYPQIAELAERQNVQIHDPASDVADEDEIASATSNSGATFARAASIDALNREDQAMPARPVEPAAKGQLQTTTVTLRSPTLSVDADAILDSVAIASEDNEQAMEVEDDAILDSVVDEDEESSPASSNIPRLAPVGEERASVGPDPSVSDFEVFDSFEEDEDEEAEEEAIALEEDAPGVETTQEAPPPLPALTPPRITDSKVALPMPAKPPPLLDDISEFEFFDEDAIPEPSPARPRPSRDDIVRQAAATHRPGASRLSPFERQLVLEAAALLGPSFAFEPLAEIVNVMGGTRSMRLDQIWRLLNDEGVWLEVDGGERSAFANMLERQRVLDELADSEGRLATLHRHAAHAKIKVADAPGNVAPVALEIAEHLVKAGDGLEAVEFILDAGQQSMVSGQNDGARRLLEYGVRLASKLEDEGARYLRGAFMVAQAELELRNKHIDRAAHRFGAARSSCLDWGNEESAAIALVGLAKIADVKGDHQGARARFRQAAEELKELDLTDPRLHQEAARACLGEALAGARLKDWTGARDALSTVIELVESWSGAEEPPARALLATSLAMSARVQRELGDNEAFIDLAERALAESHLSGVLSTTLAKLLKALAAGAKSLDVELSARLLERAETIGRAVGIGPG